MRPSGRADQVSAWTAPMPSPSGPNDDGFLKSPSTVGQGSSLGASRLAIAYAMSAPRRSQNAWSAGPSPGKGPRIAHSSASRALIQSRTPSQGPSTRPTDLATAFSSESKQEIAVSLLTCSETNENSVKFSAGA